MIAILREDDGSEERFDIPQFAWPPLLFMRLARLWTIQDWKQTGDQITASYRQRSVYDLSHHQPM